MELINHLIFNKWKETTIIYIEYQFHNVSYVYRISIFIWNGVLGKQIGVSLSCLFAVEILNDCFFNCHPCRSCHLSSAHTDISLRKPNSLNRLILQPEWQSTAPAPYSSTTLLHYSHIGVPMALSSILDNFSTNTLCHGIPKKYIASYFSYQ